MRKIEFEEAKSIELEILKNIASFCDKHNLRYYLTYGTLIGAIRHKGFIPWDDDIDIQMPQKDYEQFIKLFKHPHLKAIVPGTPMAKHTFVKVIDTRTVKMEPGFDYSNGYLGIDVDIFPLDGTPENDAEFETWYKQLMNYYKKYYYSTQTMKGSLKHKLKLAAWRLILRSPDYYLNQIKKLHDQYSYEDCKYVGSITCLYDSPKNRVPKTCFESTVDVEFEGYTFKAPVGYDYLLTHIYGDYMKLPPIEQQVTHHSNNTFWKD